MTQPVPKISQEDVERIARRDFCEDQLPLVLSILDEISKRRKWEAQAHA